MKKIVIAIISILLACTGLAFLAHHLDTSSVKKSTQNLIIYNWGDYLDPQLIKKFERQTGYHILMKQCILKSNKVEQHMI